MSRVSIKNIAEKVGVSNATVSLVLNGKGKDGRVGAAMAEKIKKVAKELNYEPNNLARSLRVGKSKTIGLIVADITNPFFANLAFHIQEYAEEFGYTVIITNTNESASKLRERLNILKSQQVDGFIITPAEDSENDIDELVKNNIPVVLLDRFYPELGVSYVAVDNYHASKNSIQYLLKQGCKRIAILVYKNKLFHMQERKRGYIEAMQKAGYYDKTLLKEISYDNIENDVASAISDLLKSDQKLDGIFFATNSISVLGIKQLLSKGIKVTEDVKVVCFDKSEAFEFSDIKIPHVTQPIPEMGKRAAGVLIEQIEQKKMVPSKTELYSTLSGT